MDTDAFFRRCTVYDDQPPPGLQPENQDGDSRRPTVNPFADDSGFGGPPIPSSSSSVPMAGRRKSTSRRKSLSKQPEMSKSKKRKWIATLTDVARNHAWNQSEDSIPEIDEVTLDRLLDVPPAELSMVFVEAIRTGNLDAAKVLLNPRIERLDINAVDEEYRTGLHWAIFERQVDFAINFILARSDVNISMQDNQGNTPLHIACDRGIPEIVELLVPMNPRAINTQNDERWTPFHEAVDKEQLDIVRLIIKQLENDPINDFDRTCFYIQKDDGETILHIAAYRGNTEIMKHLLNHLMARCSRAGDVQAVLEIVDENDTEAIDRAREEQNQEIVELMASATMLFESGTRFETLGAYSREQSVVTAVSVNEFESLQWACGAWGVHRCPFESDTHQCYPMGAFDQNPHQPEVYSTSQLYTSPEGSNRSGSTPVSELPSQLTRTDSERSSLQAMFIEMPDIGAIPDDGDC